MKLPDRCPTCSGKLLVTSLACPHCAIRIEGSFETCPVCSLGGAERELLELFLRVRGNAKEVERSLGVSYPTVRARLDRVWAGLQLAAPVPEPVEQSALATLAELRAGGIGVDQAAALLRNRGRPPAGSA